MLDRRNFIRLSAATSLGALSIQELLAQAANGKAIDAGWVDRKQDVKLWTQSNEGSVASACGYSGAKVGKRVVRLWKYLERAQSGPFSPFHQKIGDCVSQAGIMGGQTLSAVQSVTGFEEYSGLLSTEVAYGGSRIDIGEGVIRGDGSTGVWMANFLKKFGILKRGEYGEHDLTNYRPDLAKLWGRKGVPAELKRLSKAHPIKSITLLDGGFNQACELIASGYPVAICSNRGFSSRRDKDGFLSPWGIWMHAMLAIGFRTVGRRGLCIVNSWGPDWVSGGLGKYGTPTGGFWIDDHVADNMLGQGDSFAYSDLVGFPRRELDYDL